MSEPETHAEGRKAIQDLLDRIEDSDWVVVDYDPDIDPYDSLSVTATIERQSREIDADVVSGTDEQRERITTVKDVISRLEPEFDEGAPIDAVVDMCCDEYELEPEEVVDEIEKLRAKGEVYEPTVDHLRAT